MKLWINWIAAMLLAMVPMVLHLIWNKPKSESSSYDLAGIITNPPNTNAEESLRSFATIRSIDDVELPIQEIRNCLLRSRELSRAHAAKMTVGVTLEKRATESAGLSAGEALSELRAANKERPATQYNETQSEPESENVIRSNNPQNITQSPGNLGCGGSKRHVSNIDAALEIRSRRA